MFLYNLKSKWVVIVSVYLSLNSRLRWSHYCIKLLNSYNRVVLWWQNNQMLLFYMFPYLVGCCTLAKRKAAILSQSDIYMGINYPMYTHQVNVKNKIFQRESLDWSSWGWNKISECGTENWSLSLCNLTDFALKLTFLGSTASISLNHLFISRVKVRYVLWYNQVLSNDSKIVWVHSHWKNDSGSVHISRITYSLTPLPQHN